jgi:hypothetical protein
MGLDHHKKSSDPMKSSSEGQPELHKSSSVMIARIAGILCVAGGFILGIQGLEQPDSPLLPTALGMIVAGLVAQVFALGRSWYLYSQRNI